jgi:hypothetical protein
MRFKADENLPLEAATILREAKFDVETVWDEALSGAADEILASRVQQESRILITWIWTSPPFRHTHLIATLASSSCDQKRGTQQPL